MKFGNRIGREIVSFAVTTIAVSVEGKRRKRVKRRTDAVTWNDMNKGHALQGYVPLDRETTYIANLTRSNSLSFKTLLEIEAEADAEESKGDNMEVSPERGEDEEDEGDEDEKPVGRTPDNRGIPEAILRMRRHQGSIKREKERKLASSAAHAPSLLLRFMGVKRGGKNSPVHPGPAPRPIVEFKNGEFAKRYESNIAITHNRETALRRILLRHLIGSNAYDRGGDINIFDNYKISDTFILMTELRVLMDWVWGAFHPLGMELSLDQKKEVDEQFLEWRAKITSECKSKKMNGWTRITGVYFIEFAMWFMTLCALISPTLRLEKVDYEIDDDFLYCRTMSRQSIITIESQSASGKTIVDHNECLMSPAH